MQFLVVTLCLAAQAASEGFEAVVSGLFGNPRMSCIAKAMKRSRV